MSLDSMLMKLRLSFITLVFIFFSGTSQNFQLTAEAEISIGSGESLNDAFGHNAFRIRDLTQGIDVVYGYGEYDFDAPNFYLKFAQGKLNYLISKTIFLAFTGIMYITTVQ